MLDALNYNYIYLEDSVDLHKYDEHDEELSLTYRNVDVEKIANKTWVMALSMVTILLAGVLVLNSNQVRSSQDQFAHAIVEKRDISRAITQVAPSTPLAESSHQATTMASPGDQNTFTINLRIRGIDYSDKMAQVWVTVKNQTVAYNIDPIALLDPQDDGDGIIHVPVTFPQGVVHPGDEYTACIKIVVHSDNLGDTFSCQKGIVGSTSPAEPMSQALTNNTANRSNQTQVQPYTVNLFL